MSSIKQAIPCVPQVAGLTTGGIKAVVGLVVIVGWHLHRSRLIQVSLGFPPLCYGTAVACLLSSLTLLTLANRMQDDLISCSYFPSTVPLSNIEMAVRLLDTLLDQHKTTFAGINK